MPKSHSGNNRRQIMCEGAHENRYSLLVTFLLATAFIAGCGPSGTITYKGLPNKTSKASATTSNGVLTSVQAVVIAADEHCENGGIKLVNTSDTSEAPVYVCSEQTKRIYEVTAVNLASLPATGSLNACAASGNENCLVPSGFKAVAATELDATKIAVGTTVAGVSGSFTGAYSACTSDGQVGCISDASFKSADMSKLIASNVKNGVSIAGVTGGYPSVAFPLASNTGTADLPAFASTVGGTSYEWFTSDGTAISGTIMADQSVTPSTAAQNLSAGLYRSVSVAGDADLVATKILSGQSIFGINGSVTAESHSPCGTDGEQGCITNANYKAAK